MHGMKVVERVQVKRLLQQCLLMKCDSVLIEKGMIVAMFVFRSWKEENHVEGKTLHMCFVDLEKVISRAARVVWTWVMRKKGM